MPLRRDAVIPLTPMEQQQDAARGQRLKDAVIRRAIPVKPQLPRSHYLNEPAAQVPRKGIRSKNPTNVIDLRFLEGPASGEKFERGLELLNRHRLDAGQHALDLEQLAKEYPGSLASEDFKLRQQREKDAYWEVYDREHPAYQWAQPGARTIVNPLAKYRWAPR